MYSAKPGIREIVQLCADKGIEHVVISPGSRNAPLSLSFGHHAALKEIVIHDERSAAFFALGIAQQTRKTVAIVCTSGSAALNYAPAIAEAYYQKIPLLVLTADRPKAWVDQSDGQTIRQQDIYFNYIKKSFETPEVKNEEDAWYLNRIMNEAIAFTNYPDAGPVHVNIPMSEPLYQRTLDEPEAQRIIKIVKGVNSIDAQTVSSLSEYWNKAKKVMIIVGQQPPSSQLNDVIGEIAALSNTVVLTETSSNLYHKNFISTIDRVIDGFTEEEKQNFAPELLISFGSAVISKKVKGWLRKFAPVQHWHISETDLFIDTYKHLTHNITVSELTFFQHLGTRLKSNESNYASLWEEKNALLRTRHAEYLKQARWSDLKAFEIILKNLPSCHLQMGNSTPVRYVQLFEMQQDVRYDSNRGTSGIDGATSTAAGAAYVHKGLTVLITGDVGFYYDSNALWNHYLSPDLRIILINNSGGNIFRIIDGPEKNEDIEKYFEARQNYEAAYLCQQFNIRYLKAENESDLGNLIPHFYEKSNRPKLLEIITPNVTSAGVLKDYFSKLK